MPSDFQSTEQLVPIRLEQIVKGVLIDHPDFIMYGYGVTPPTDSNLKPTIQNEYTGHIRQNNYVGGFAGQNVITERRYQMKSILHFPADYPIIKVYQLMGHIGDVFLNAEINIPPSIVLYHDQTAESRFKETDNVQRIHLTVTFKLLELS